MEEKSICNFDKKYLNPEHLAGFENYKYSSSDTSPLSKHVMHPFWNTVVKICPPTIAPNVLTFVGFLFTTLNFVMLTYYDYNYYAASEEPPGDDYPAVPHWVWLLMAVFHFTAHTLDGIDGKQARRTGTSGPLGELFDHGLDSWTAFFIPACLWSVFGRVDFSISPIRFYFVLCNVLFCFYTSHWEKYLTKVLFLPWGYDVSQMTIFLVYILTGIFGAQLWKFEVFGFPAGALSEIMMYCGSLLSSLPMSFWNVYKSYRDGTGKMLGPVEALRPFICPAVLFVVFTVWVFTSPGDIINSDPRLFTYLIGAVFANINCQLIVSQMSSTRCEVWHWSLLTVPLVLGVIIIAPILELPLVWVLSVVATMHHLHYGICVVRQMCNHFNISCFTIADRSD